MIIYNKSLRKFNKSRKRLPLGKDNNGKVLYPYDFVRVQISYETRSSHCSQIHWNALDGAFINAHPAHIQLRTSTHRNLRDYFQESFGEEKITCVKITYPEYLEWTKLQEEKDKERQEKLSAEQERLKNVSENNKKLMEEYPVQDEMWASRRWNEDRTDYVDLSG